LRLNIRKLKFKEVAPVFLKVFEDYRAYGYVETAGEMWSNSVKRCKREILLRNARYSRDVTYAELLSFLRKAGINRKRYVPERYVCRHYATKLHNRAEKLGIRTGVAYIEFNDVKSMHSINVFDTLDKGLVFIDCTGIRQKHKQDYTAFTDLKIGGHYTKKCLFVDKTAELNWSVKRFDITW